MLQTNKSLIYKFLPAGNASAGDEYKNTDTKKLTAKTWRKPEVPCKNWFDINNRGGCETNTHQVLHYIHIYTTIRTAILLKIHEDKQVSGVVQ